ncbi:MAG: 50S ribosomal protein L21 [candidate division Zixibacteria bacterium]|nr:50S ribosomal protein L21 [candidate division Zixibacteria bacterium]
MYAVFQIAGFQYTAEEGATLKIPYREAEAGTKFDIDEILLIRDDDRILTGTPLIEKAKIKAEILGSGRAEKQIVYKYKRRTKYRRTQGHRQDYSEIRVNKIIVPKG